MPIFIYMKWGIVYIILSIFYISGNAQATLFEKSEMSFIKTSDPVTLSSHDSPFVSMTVKWNRKTLSDSLFYESTDGEKKLLVADPHSKSTQGTIISSLEFLDPDLEFYFTTNSNLVQEIEIHLYYPGHTLKDESQSVPKAKNFTCDCEQPSFWPRAQWCPSGNCPPSPYPIPTQVTHLIVHHSAGSNQSTDWPAVVRAIWNYHVNSNGWADIGYNWLVDPEGVLYEGRGDGIKGAHFCGYNTATMGLCMIGDYTDIEPSDTAVQTLTKMLSWNVCNRQLDPLESEYHPSSDQVLQHISGHRDGCNTACPGNTFYPMLDEVRTQVDTNLRYECTSLLSPTLLANNIDSFPKAFLTWNDNSLNESHFELFSSVDGSSFALLTTLPADTTWYQSDTLLANKIYEYKVRAINAMDTTLFSNTVLIDTQISSDENLSPHEIKIYPNPAGEYLFLVGENLIGTPYILFNSIGIAVKQGTIKSAKIEISDFHPGSYYLILDDNGVSTIKPFQKL